MPKAQIPLDAQAARLASQADYYFREGNYEKAYGLYGRSAKLTEKCIENSQGPKSRALLMGNAVVLWYKARNFERMEQLAHTYLANDPPESIVDKLRDALVHGWHEKYLPKHTHFVDMEIGLSGPSIGIGYAPVDEVAPRENAMQALLWKAVEYESGEKLRTRGMPSDEIADLAQLYTSIGGIGSYKMRFKVIAHGIQKTFPATKRPEIITGETLVHRAVDLATLVATGSPEELSEAIPDVMYRVSFMKTVRDLAPDGKRVCAVQLGGGKTQWRSTYLTHDTKVRVKSDIGTVYSNAGYREIKGKLVGIELQASWLVAKVETPRKVPCHIATDSEIAENIVKLFRGRVVVVGRDEGSKFVVTHVEQDTEP